MRLGGTLPVFCSFSFFPQLAPLSLRHAGHTCPASQQGVPPTKGYLPVRTWSQFPDLVVDLDLHHALDQDQDFIVGIVEFELK